MLKMIMTFTYLWADRIDKDDSLKPMKNLVDYFFYYSRACQFIKF